MDLPLILESRKMVDDVAEKNQEIEICLHQMYGTILHNIQMGTDLSEHMVKQSMIEDAVENTLSVIEDIRVDIVRVEGSQITIGYVYNGKQQNYITDVSR